jgi:hypothetical protein
MPSRDIYHEPVKRALIAAGWTITHDPYMVIYGDDRAYIDLAADQLLAAEQGRAKIAVEVKSMQKDAHSPITDVHSAIGQYLLYRTWLDEQEPDRMLYLAVSQEAAENILARPGVVAFLNRYQVNILVVDLTTEEVLRWEQR